MTCRWIWTRSGCSRIHYKSTKSRQERKRNQEESRGKVEFMMIPQVKKIQVKTEMRMRLQRRRRKVQVQRRSSCPDQLEPANFLRGTMQLRSGRSSSGGKENLAIGTGREHKALPGSGGARSRSGPS